MKVLVHAQHLSGVGHRVRALEIARSLAASHRVVLVDGGRPVPRAGSDGIECLALPRIARRAGALVPLEPGGRLPAVLAERRRRLVRCAAELAPDALIVEHYPFSKWELEPEITAVVDAVRTANPAVRVVCSVRDVCRRTRHEEGDDERVARRVNESLQARFDAVVVHADERFTRLDEHFSGARDLVLPVFHTGFVAERRRPVSRGAAERSGHAVLSVGGGTGSADFALRCIAAWRRLHEARGPGAPVLVVFAGLFWTDEELGRVRAAVANGPFLLKPFGVDLLDWLVDASLSISRAGYNTATNLLETGCPALVVPHPDMSDQAFRARRLSELGLVETLASDDGSEGALLDAMGRALDRPRRVHDLDLDGATRTRRLLEALVAAGPDLLALAREAGRLRDLAPVTALPSPVRRRAAFALDFEGGPRRKGRRVQSVDRARTVARLLSVAGPRFAPLLGHRGDALLLAWVPGPTLDTLPAIPAEVLRRCGEALAALHALPVPPDVAAPLRSADELHARLAADASRLVRAGAIDAGLARRALEVARVHLPQRPSTGIVHRDFCGENIVLDASGAPVCIDNASLALGCHDFDLARSWARWPLSPDDRDRFAEGYTGRRSLDAFFPAFPFWACCALLSSAAKRVRTRTGREKPPLDRLRRLLGVLEGASEPGAAWRVV